MAAPCRVMQGATSILSYRIILKSRNVCDGAVSFLAKCEGRAPRDFVATTWTHGCQWGRHPCPYMDKDILPSLFLGIALA